MPVVLGKIRRHSGAVVGHIGSTASEKEVEAAIHVALENAHTSRPDIDESRPYNRSYDRLGVLEDILRKILEVQHERPADQRLSQTERLVLANLAELANDLQCYFGRRNADHLSEPWHLHDEPWRGTAERYRDVVDYVAACLWVKVCPAWSQAYGSFSWESAKRLSAISVDGDWNETDACLAWYELTPTEARKYFGGKYKRMVRGWNMFQLTTHFEALWVGNEELTWVKLRELVAASALSESKVDYWVRYWHNLLITRDILTAWNREQWPLPKHLKTGG
jgi:hypothetical protein